MLSKYGLSPIIFCAVAAFLAVFSVVIFIVALARGKRPRRALDRLALAYSSILFIIAFCVSAISAANFFADKIGIALAVSGNKLTFSVNSNELFSAPYLGAVIVLLDKLGLLGFIAPVALFALSLADIIAVACSARRKYEPSAFTEESAAIGADSEENAIAEADGAQDKEAFGIEPQKELTQTETEDFGAEEALDGLDDVAADGVLAEQAKNILEEIDKLVTDSENEPRESANGENIDVLLKKAIAEGNALFDTLNKARVAAESGEKSKVEQAVGDKLEGEKPRVEPATERKKKQPADDTETVASPERTEPFAKFDRKRKEIEVVDYEQHEEPREIKPAVRTIVRRPVAKSIDEIKDRAEEILEDKAEEGSAPRAQRAKSPKAKTARSESASEEAPAPEKTVEAETGGLPLTRKYIILNRHNAAAVFNDYLNSKRKQEKEELTGSLNTIIMK